MSILFCRWFARQKKDLGFRREGRLPSTNLLEQVNLVVNSDMEESGELIRVANSGQSEGGCTDASSTDE